MQRFPDRSKAMPSGVSRKGPREGLMTVEIARFCPAPPLALVAIASRSSNDAMRDRESLADMSRPADRDALPVQHHPIQEQRTAIVTAALRYRAGRETEIPQIGRAHV